MWQSYEEQFESLYNKDYDGVHFDTRDFAFGLNVSFVKEICKPKTILTNPEHYYYDTINEVLDIIKHLYNESGGKGEWRMLSISEISFLCGWNMKYITIVKDKNTNKYCIVVPFNKTEGEYRIVSKTDIKKPINKKYLNHY
jgi:hypothetical protein